MLNLLRLNFGGVPADFVEELKASLLKRVETVIKYAFLLDVEG